MNGTVNLALSYPSLYLLSSYLITLIICILSLYVCVCAYMHVHVYVIPGCLFTHRVIVTDLCYRKIFSLSLLTIDTHRIFCNTVYMHFHVRENCVKSIVIFAVRAVSAKKSSFLCFVLGSWTMWGRKCQFCSASAVCHYREIFLLCMLSKTLTVGHQLCSLNSGIKEKRDIWIYELLQLHISLYYMIKHTQKKIFVVWVASQGYQVMCSEWDYV